MKRLLVVLAAVGLTFACGDDNGGPTGPPPPAEVDLTGTWEGNVTTSGGTSSTLTLSLVEDADGRLSGSGRFDVGSESLAISVSAGSHTSDSFSMTLSAQGLEDLSYDGTVESCNRLTGNFRGSGFTGQSVAMTRQGSCPS